MNSDGLQLFRCLSWHESEDERREFAEVKMGLRKEIVGYEEFERTGETRVRGLATYSLWVHNISLVVRIPDCSLCFADSPAEDWEVP